MPTDHAESARPMMVGIWPKKVGEDTVAWTDTCSYCSASYTSCASVEGAQPCCPDCDHVVPLDGTPDAR